jgi:hypothetical protein
MVENVTKCPISILYYICRADMMNTKTALAAIAIVSALALVVAPAMVGTALAKKEEVCVLKGGNECPNDVVAAKNRNAEEECRAGHDLQNTNANCPK